MFCTWLVGESDKLAKGSRKLDRVGTIQIFTVMKDTAKRLSLAELKAKGKGIKSESLEKIKGGRLNNCHTSEA